MARAGAATSVSNSIPRDRREIRKDTVTEKEKKMKAEKKMSQCRSAFVCPSKPVNLAVPGPTSLSEPVQIQNCLAQTEPQQDCYQVVNNNFDSPPFEHSNQT